MGLLDKQIAKNKILEKEHPKEAKKRKEEYEKQRQLEAQQREEAKRQEEIKKQQELETIKKEKKAVSKTTKTKEKVVEKPIIKEVEPLIDENKGIYKYIGALLIDHTTNQNIIFAEDEYEGHDPQEHYTEEVMKELIASKKLNYRVRKSLEQQKERTKKKAEVFTPSWIWKDMIDMCQLPKNWEDLVSSLTLEITCGEAPFITSRYDPTTGEPIPIKERIGILDRKLMAVNKHTNNKEDWLKYAIRSLKTTYGYEWQGDNLFIARVNVLRCFVENYFYKFNEQPDPKIIKTVIYIITWNFWQMDGLKDTVPMTNIPAKIIDWTKTNKNHEEIIEFRSCKEGE